MDIRQQIAGKKIQEEKPPPKHRIGEEKNLSYLYAARDNPRRYETTTSVRNKVQTPSLAEFGRDFVATYQTADLIDLYFYINYVGKLAAIRRAIIHEIFNDRNDKNFKLQTPSVIEGRDWPSNLLERKSRSGNSRIQPGRDKATIGRLRAVRALHKEQAPWTQEDEGNQGTPNTGNQVLGKECTEYQG